MAKKKIKPPILSEIIRARTGGKWRCRHCANSHRLRSGKPISADLCECDKTEIRRKEVMDWLKANS